MHYADCGIYDTGYDPYSGDTAFLGKLVRKVSRAVVRNPVTSLARKAFVPAMVTEKLYNVGRGIARGGPKALLPIAIQALPHVQQAMKMAGPMGMLASGAAGALAATVQGKSLENIAWAAAEGASPPGIDRAVAAAKALRQGQPVMNIAINQIRQGFPANSPAQHAFDLGVATVKGGSKGMMAAARNKLRTAAERAAYDSAVGTIAKAAANLPSTGAGPRLSMPRFKPRAPMSLLRPAVNQAVQILRRQPALMRLSPNAFSSRYGIPLRRVIEARGVIEASGVVEVGVITDKLWVYTLKSGDTGSGLAAKFTGDSSRWRELPQVNKRGMGQYSGSKDMVVKQTTTTINGKRVPVTLLDPFYSGLKINLPGDWNGGAFNLPSITTGTPGAEPPVTTIPEVIVTPGPGYPPPPATVPPPIVPPPIVLPPSVPVATPPPVIAIPPVTTPPISIPPVSTPPVGPIPPVSTPPIDIPSVTTPPIGIPIGLPPVTSTPPPVTSAPPPVAVPPVASEKKKDAAAAAVGIAALGALLFI